MHWIKLCSIILLLGPISCQAQTKKDMEDKNNPLLCDPVEGICGIPDSSKNQHVSVQTDVKPVKVIYFTDPICSSCWGIEPQLRKLKLEYGNSIDVEYRMGGLLPDWNYNSGGISKPSDVAHHWDEVSSYYDMPIDGDVWLTDPLHSSYPPSIAFKAAQMQNQEKAILFLRALRELVFLHKKNIAKTEVIEQAAKQVGLDAKKLLADMNGPAKVLFEEDLKYARENGVRGFPTLFFVNNQGEKELLYGAKAYAFFETSVLKLHPKANKQEYGKDWTTLFTKYTSLTAKEFSELAGMGRTESERFLNQLVQEGKLKKHSTKNGAIWMK